MILSNKDSAPFTRPIYGNSGPSAPWIPVSFSPTADMFPLNSKMMSSSTVTEAEPQAQTASTSNPSLTYTPSRIYWSNLPTKPLLSILGDASDRPALAEVLSFIRLWVHDNNIIDLDTVLLAIRLIQQVKSLDKPDPNTTALEASSSKKLLLTVLNPSKVALLSSTSAKFPTQTPQHRHLRCFITV